MKAKQIAAILFLNIILGMFISARNNITRFEQIDLENGYRSIGRYSFSKSITYSKELDQLSVNLNRFGIYMERGMETMKSNGYECFYSYEMDSREYLLVDYRIAKGDCDFHRFVQTLWSEGK